MKKIINKCNVIIFVLTLMLSFSFFNPISTKAEIDTKNFFVIDTIQELQRVEIDKIITLGEMLSYKDVNLIFNITNQNGLSGNEECKNIYYEYIKKQTSFKKVIVISYYTDTKEIECYDDYGIFTDEFLTKLEKTVKQFHNGDMLNEGLIYLYQSTAKEINESMDLKIKNISDLEIVNPFDKKIFSLKNIILLTLIATIMFGFRRNKDF